MRDDLLDAQATIDWAVTQIPCLEKRFAAYRDRRPYIIEMKADSHGSGEMLLVASCPQPPDPILNAEVGAIINAIRTSLDFLMTSLVRRRCGVNSNASTRVHFPIFKLRADFLRKAREIKRKDWLAEGHLASIKAFKPYKRGNPRLYALNAFDNLRKHTRLIEVRPMPARVSLPMFMAGARHEWRHLKNQSILLRFPPGTDFRPTEDNCDITLQIAFHEPSLGLKHAPVVETLRDFALIATSIVRIFDTP